MASDQKGDAQDLSPTESWGTTESWGPVDVEPDTSGDVQETWGRAEAKSTTAGDAPESSVRAEAKSTTAGDAPESSGRAEAKSTTAGDASESWGPVEAKPDTSGDVQESWGSAEAKPDTSGDVQESWGSAEAKSTTAGDAPESSGPAEDNSTSSEPMDMVQHPSADPEQDQTDAFHDPKVKYEIDPEDDQQFIELTELAQITGIEEARFIAWPTVGTINNITAAMHTSQGSAQATAKVIFSAPENRRGSVLIPIRLPRNMHRKVNPEQASAFHVNLEILFQDIVAFSYVHYPEGLSHLELMERCDYAHKSRGLLNSQNKTDDLFRVRITAVRCLVQNIVVPILKDAKNTQAVNAIIRECQIASPSHPLYIDVMLKDQIHAGSSLLQPELETVDLSIRAERKVDPLAIFFKGAPHTGTLTKGNAVPWFELPRLNIQRAKVVHADMYEYAVNQVYGRIGENQFETTVADEYNDAQFEVGHIPLANSITKEGGLANVYLAMVKFEQVAVSRPQPGDKFRIDYFQLEKPKPQVFDKFLLYFYNNQLVDRLDLVRIVRDRLHADHAAGTKIIPDGTFEDVFHKAMVEAEKSSPSFVPAKPDPDRKSDMKDSMDQMTKFLARTVFSQIDSQGKHIWGYEIAANADLIQEATAPVIIKAANGDETLARSMLRAFCALFDVGLKDELTNEAAKDAYLDIEAQANVIMFASRRDAYLFACDTRPAEDGWYATSSFVNPDTQNIVYSVAYTQMDVETIWWEIVSQMQDKNSKPADEDEALATTPEGSKDAQPASDDTQGNVSEDKGQEIEKAVEPVKDDDVPTTEPDEARDNDDDEEEDTFPEENEDLDVNVWSAVVIDPPTFCPPGYVAMAVRRRREPHWQGATEERPFVTTEIPCEDLDQLATESCTLVIRNTTQVLLKKVQSNQPFKDDLRCFEELQRGPLLSDVRRFILGNFKAKHTSISPEVMDQGIIFSPSTEPFDLLSDDRVGANLHGHLNESQLEAYNACRAILYPMTIINGPPGTGKTEVVVTIGTELALCRNRHQQVLYVTEGNAQVDSAALRFRAIANKIKEPLRIIRVHSLITERCKTRDHWAPDNQPSRFTAEMDALTVEFLAQREVYNIGIKESTRQDNERFVLKEMSLSYAMVEAAQTLGSDPQVKAMLGALRSLKEYGYTSETGRVAITNGIDALFRYVMGSAHVLCMTLNMASKVKVHQTIFPELVIQDEACRSKEISSTGLLAFYRCHVISVGDPKQLQPTILTAGREHDKPVPFVNPFYRQSQLSLHERMTVTGMPVVTLKHQFRSHGEIFRWASHEFYNDALIDASTKGHPGIKVVRDFTGSLGAKPSSILWVEVNNCRSFPEPGGGTSTVSPDQHAVVMDHLMKAFQILPRTEKIMIICMYKAMATEFNKERLLLPEDEQERLLIQTVDASQGKEEAIVMLVLGRSTSPGFIGQANRLNVGATRAKFGLFIYGTKNMFASTDNPNRNPRTRHLVSLHNFCKKNEHYLIVQAASFKCLDCGEAGHIARDCQKCANCGGTHKMTDCPEPLTEKGENFKRSKTKCKRCFKMGHYATDCPQCKHCDKEHDSTTCPERFKNMECRRCHKTGHPAADCPTKNDVTCRRCYQQGHIQKDCTTALTRELQLQLQQQQVRIVKPKAKEPVEAAKEEPEKGAKQAPNDMW